MQKWLYSLILLSISFFAGACHQGVAYVAGKQDYPPISWNNDGIMDGIAFDVMSEILAEKNIRIERVPPHPWKRILKSAGKGEIDIIVSIRETEERRGYLHFVPTALLSTAQNVFFLDNQSIKTREDLIGKMGGITLGVRFDGEFDVFAKRHLQFDEVALLQQNIRKLQSKRIDYFISPLLTTLHYMHNNRTLRQNDGPNITYLAHPLFTANEKVAISMKSDCSALADYIDKRLAEYHSQGIIDRVLEEQFIRWGNITRIMDEVSRHQ
ncbi:substrate-binding periplasmic protein [Oleiphilus messinensis]|uniref:substrate-binding periplasmic protein n=1 Tax=Oleiphilus messinensis TaxID=141451 RepID=UPI0012FC75E4|nr:transporter substrate-binding domain-containing protein [Oleiphilus messinensis]